MKDGNKRRSRGIRRLARREMRSSRAAISLSCALLLLLPTMWVAAELLLSLASANALVLPPATLAQGVVDVATQTRAEVLLAAGVALALVGAVLVLLAVLPGAKPRQIMDSRRCAIVVDNEVLASALSRTARRVAGLAPEQVASTVGHRSVEVALKPGPGRTVDAAAAFNAVEAEVAGYGLVRTLKVARPEAVQA